jgi:hypothetical protein
MLFYHENGEEKDASGVTYAQRYQELGRLCFPKGLRKVDRDSLQGPPTAGVVIRAENDTTRPNGLRLGMVICVQDGYIVENLTQFRFVGQLVAANDTMALVVWDGSRYRDVTMRLITGMGHIERRSSLADYQASPSEAMQPAISTSPSSTIQTADSAPTSPTALIAPFPPPTRTTSLRSVFARP